MERSSLKAWQRAFDGFFSMMRCYEHDLNEGRKVVLIHEDNAPAPNFSWGTPQFRSKDSGNSTLQDHDSNGELDNYKKFCCQMMWARQNIRSNTRAMLVSAVKPGNPEIPDLVSNFDFP